MTPADAGFDGALLAPFTMDKWKHVETVQVPSWASPADRYITSVYYLVNGGSIPDHPVAQHLG